MADREQAALSAEKAQRLESRLAKIEIFYFTF
jgi:hypothetical protein